MANDRDVFLPLPLFLLSSSFRSKLTPPPRFLLGTIARHPTNVTWDSCFGSRYASGGATTRRKDDFFASTVLIISFVFGDLSAWASSSANIWSSREDRWWLNFLLLMAVVETLLKTDVWCGVASDFNCFPRFKIVSWHSANFAEAAVISQPCKLDQQVYSIWTYFSFSRLSWWFVSRIYWHKTKWS